MGDEEIELLCEQFSIYPGKTKFKVTLTGKRVLINQTDSSGRERSEDIILLDDVTGCYVLEDKRKSALAAYLSIFSYPLKKKKLGSGVVRHRIERTFTIECKKTRLENSMVAEKWKMTIKRLIAGEKIRTIEDIENGSLAARNLLVLINPFSGRKIAEKMYKEKVRPMFIEAEIKHTVRKTEYAGHAKEMAKELKLEDWDGIVIVSGDGLVHEVINGFMDRPDWKEAIKMPIGIIPGGSGNALAAALVYASTGSHNVASCPVMCAFEICRGAISKLDLLAVETQDSGGYRNPAFFGNAPKPRNIEYSFLDVVLGLIADIDIESESLRCFGGEIRVIIYALIRTLFLRKYHIEVSYLPYDDSCASNNKEGCIPEDGSGDAGKVTQNPEALMDLPSLDDPVPDNWVTEEDDYVMVMANTLSHVAHDTLAQKKSKLDDGKIFLNLSDHSVTRRQIFKAWNNMEIGLGLHHDSEDEPSKSTGRTVQCTAVRFIPKGRPHIIDTDGEALPFGPLQCSILPSMARVMTALPH